MTWREFRRDAQAELAEARKSRRDWVAIAIAGVAAGAAIGAAYYTSVQASEAAAARIQVATDARRAIEVTERPWVALEARIGGPFTFLAKAPEGYVSSGGAVFPVVVTLSNSGHSPASGLNLRSELIAPMVWDPLKERERLCDEAKQQESQNPRAFSDVLFPGTKMEQERSLTIDRDQVSSTAKQSGGVIGPYVVMCLAYRPAYSDQIHRTAVVLALRQDRVATKPRFPGDLYGVDTLIVPPNEIMERVPAERLHLFPVGTGTSLTGTFAD